MGDMGAFYAADTFNLPHKAGALNSLSICVTHLRNRTAVNAAEINRIGKSPNRNISNFRNCVYLLECALATRTRIDCLNCRRTQYIGLYFSYGHNCKETLCEYEVGAVANDERYLVFAFVFVLLSPKTMTRASDLHMFQDKSTKFTTTH
jgi:hypothetical protein